MKRCTKCRQTKDESEFYPSAHTGDGLHPACKECERLRHRKPNPQSGPYSVTPPRAKYRSIKVNGKKMQLHRYLMEQHLGRQLGPDEDVHHINGDTHDNRIENLAVISHSSHAQLSNNGHHRGGWKWSTTSRQKLSNSLLGNTRGRGKKSSHPR